MFKNFLFFILSFFCFISYSQDTIAHLDSNSVDDITPLLEKYTYYKDKFMANCVQENITYNQGNGFENL